jgi:hypothetical protein
MEESGILKGLTQRWIKSPTKACCLSIHHFWSCNWGEYWEGSLDIAHFSKSVTNFTSRKFNKRTFHHFNNFTQNGELHPVWYPASCHTGLHTPLLRLYTDWSWCDCFCCHSLPWTFEADASSSYQKECNEDNAKKFHLIYKTIWYRKLSELVSLWTCCLDLVIYFNNCLLTVSSNAACPMPKAAPDPARPIKWEAPMLEAKREAPTLRKVQLGTIIYM